jgi:glycosyltransferase involved in cell wall biosynthesis
VVVVAEVNIVASLIVKNELDRYLIPCVRHLEYFCDHVLVMDDGSTDGTYEWLEDNRTDRLLVERIDPEDGFFAGHEGRRRQRLLLTTMNLLPTWVLNIDADEFISDGDLVREFCEQPQHKVGTLPMEEVWKAPADCLWLRMDGGWRPHPVPCLWSSSLHGHRGRALKIKNAALACGREPETVRRTPSRPTGSSIMHFGWAKESGRQARFERYVTADGGKFHAGSHLDSIMWPDDKVRLERREWPEGLEVWRSSIVEAAS